MPARCTSAPPGVWANPYPTLLSRYRHGLLLAVSIKTINVQPYGKNLKNRFGDLCTEAITLHMRFPYSVVGALFAMPEDANRDRTALSKD